ncbi:hypothetical protein HYV81_03800 [Candidatus Woesearchaeota archaeon]|nr:hypothetical protein [Candidatus Woesearchaeota archaeon]
MKHKKGMSFLLVILVLLALFIFALYVLGINIGTAIKYAFNFVLSFITIEFIGPQKDLQVSTPVPSEEVNTAYNNFLIIFSRTYAKECLLPYPAKPADFQGFSIVFQASPDKNRQGMYIVLVGPNNVEVKRHFIGSPAAIKTPCVITGNTQVPYLIKRFGLEKEWNYDVSKYTISNPADRYAEASKITYARDRIDVQYKSGVSLIKGELKDHSLLFNVDEGHICFIPTYDTIRLPSNAYNIGIQSYMMSALAGKSAGNLC